MFNPRATPMYLVEDLDDARLHYASLGFVAGNSGNEDYCSVSAGPTHVILVNRDYAERTLPARAIALLEERPALHVPVESLDDVDPALRGRFLGEMRTDGPREWALESPDGLIVLAETRTTH